MYKIDEIAQYNKTRWNALVDANALFTRPYLNLDEDAAHDRVDPDGRLGDLRGKDILCLAGGGGQQSAAFSLLGANVTVFDLSEGQLRRDQQAAAHYGFSIRTLQGDMRDLSALADDAFDLVWQPYSLNFVPTVQRVFGEVARVIRPAGRYQFNCANPFAAGLGPADWNGVGYVLKHPYQAGAELSYPDQEWVHNSPEAIPPPREFRHTLSTLVNGLVEAGFVLQHLSDTRDFYPDLNAEPGSWDHFTAFAPPWLYFLAVYG